MGKSTGRSPPFSIREVQVQVHLLVRPPFVWTGLDLDYDLDYDLEHLLDLFFI